jgi:hypothetical protein
MMRRRAPRGVALAACVLVSQFACAGTTTEAGPALITVAGTWNYVGMRSGQTVATTGTLALTQDQTVRFNGTFDASELDATGEVHRVVGVVSGRTIDSTAIDFDVVVDPTLTRHHSGAVRGDSLTGTWVELSDRGIVASGSFRARRRSP